MSLMPPSADPSAAKIVPWVLWFAIVTGFFLVTVMLGGKGANATTDVALIGLVPVALSVLVRLLVLPRVAATAAFPVYIVTLALAEGGGFIGVLMGGQYRVPVIGAAAVVLLLQNPALAAVGRANRTDGAR